VVVEFEVVVAWLTVKIDGLDASSCCRCQYPQLLKSQTQASASVEFDDSDGDKCAPHRVLNKKLGMVNQLRIFTNGTSSIFPQEEYEEDIALEKVQLRFV
jgi:hypothetical protein